MSQNVSKIRKGVMINGINLFSKLNYSDQATPKLFDGVNRHSCSFWYTSPVNMLKLFGAESEYLLPGFFDGSVKVENHLSYVNVCCSRDINVPRYTRVLRDR